MICRIIRTTCPIHSPNPAWITACSSGRVLLYDHDFLGIAEAARRHLEEVDP